MIRQDKQSGAITGTRWAACAPRSIVFLVLASMLAAGGAGCAQLRPEQAAAGEQAPAGEFLHEQLQKESAVTVAEAYRAMVMLIDGEDMFHNFEEREAYLMGREVVRPSWHLRRNECIDRGAVAYMVLRAMDVRGGVNLRTLGRLPLADRRYAYRELVYMDMMPPAPAYRYMTGGELVTLIGKADDYMAAHGMYAAKTVKVDELLETTTQEGAATSAPAGAEMK